VIKLNRPVVYRLAHRRPTRALVLRRDAHRCQYCGVRGATTIDHVMPQSRGGKDTWENLVTACGPCNHGKADRTPEEAGMKLLKRKQRLAPDLYSEVLARMTRAVGG
jgi:5-methylcytosine-specific restriction endonuclease McrA